MMRRLLVDDILTITTATTTTTTTVTTSCSWGRDRGIYTTDMTEWDDLLREARQIESKLEVKETVQH